MVFYMLLLGESGSGKSTIGSLLLRYYDVNGGCVLVGGEDIRKVNPTSLRQYIGTVSQVKVQIINKCRIERKKLRRRRS